MCLRNSDKNSIKQQCGETGQVTGIFDVLTTARYADLLSEKVSPVVGFKTPANGETEKEEKIHLNVRGKTRPQRKFEMYMDAWKRSRLPEANFHLTTNLTSEKRKRYCAGNKTVASFFGYIFDAARRVLRAEGIPLNHVWVLEARGGNYHVHSLLYLPNKEIADKLMKALLRQLVPDDFEWGMKISNELFFKNSGLPVHGGWINPELEYGTTGCTGLGGMTEYLMKDLCITSSMRNSYRLGKLVGASQSITHLTTDVQTHSTNKSSYRLRDT